MKPVFRTWINGRQITSEHTGIAAFWTQCEDYVELRTDLTDRNGQWIYEGDIVEMDWPCGWDEEEGTKYERVQGIVFWDGSNMMWKHPNGVDYLDIDDDALVVGNVAKNEEAAEEIEEAYEANLPF